MNQFKIAFIIILTILSNITIAQPENLVPNPSFEEYWLCPSNQGQIARAKGWRSVNFSPDYFHECATDPAFGVPYNVATFQYPRTGRAYVGIIYAIVGTYPPYWENGKSEIISTRLKEKLEINKRYYVTFFVNYALQDSAHLVGSRMIMNKIGVLFSTKDYSMDTTIISHYVSNLDPLPNFSHIYASQIIGDTLNWVEVSGSFIADSAYEYINIGIFFDINNLDTIMVFHDSYPPGCCALYLIDDVYVGTVPFAEYIKNENLFDIKFNDNVLMITTKANSYSLRIHDVSGRILFFKDVKEEEYCIDISFLAKGMYLVEINNEKNIKKKKILKL